MKKSELNTCLPSDVAYLLQLMDEEEQEKTKLYVTAHKRFVQVVEKLLGRLTTELSRFKERIADANVS